MSVAAEAPNVLLPNSVVSVRTCGPRRGYARAPMSGSGSVAATLTRASTIVAPPGVHHDGVQVELGDLREVLDERPDAENGVGERSHVVRGAASVPGQQGIGLELAQHLRGVGLG